MDAIQHADAAMARLNEAKALLIVLREAMPHLVPKTQAAIDVLRKRARQIHHHGRTAQHDDEHDECQLLDAAICYLQSGYTQARGYLVKFTHGKPPLNWPWAPDDWRPDTPREDLLNGIALALAELERLDRKAAARRSRLPVTGMSP